MIYLMTFVYYSFVYFNNSGIVLVPSSFFVWITSLSLKYSPRILYYIDSFNVCFVFHFILVFIHTTDDKFPNKLITIIRLILYNPINLKPQQSMITPILHTQFVKFNKNCCFLGQLF